MTLKNECIAVLDYIAVIKYGVDETEGFFGADETIQELVLRDYNLDRSTWRVKAL